MTSQEQQWLDEFLQRLAAAQAGPKDPQADAMIRERLAGQPDATYLLVQRALLLERALNDARQQITQLQQQLPAPGSGSFLGQGLDTQFGRNPVPPAYAAPPAPAYAAPAAQPGWRERMFGGGAPAQAAPAQAAPASASSSFLGQAAASAAGVAGGMFLFNGIENLLGHRHAAQAGQQQPSTGNATQNLQGDAQNQAGLDRLAHDAGGDADILGGNGNNDGYGGDGGGFFDDGDDGLA
ncbi:MAG: DUF2076 family protein [Comamonas sp.]